MVFGKQRISPEVAQDQRCKMAEHPTATTPRKSVASKSMFTVSAGAVTTIFLKGLVHDNAYARRLSLQNKFVGSTLNSK